MAHASSHGRLPGDYRHRADEIHVHRASWWQSFGPLLGLLALLALVALGAWAYMRGRARTAAPALPEISEPKLRTVPPQDVPALPPPPQVEPPAAAVGPMDQPKAEEQEPMEPTPSPKAAPAPATGSEEVIEETVISDKDETVVIVEEEEMSADPCSTTTVYFPTSATLFEDEGVSSLNKLADCLKANPTRVVLLEGSSDPRGDVAKNEELARGRAQAVADQLWALGVPTAQISLTVVPSACSETDAACWQRDRSVKALLSE